MNEQLINEQYQYILQLIGQKRLKEALTQLESFLWKCPEWSLRTRLAGYAGCVSASSMLTTLFYMYCL